MLRFGLILAALVIVADQITKYLILGPGQFSPPGCLEAGFNCGFVELGPVMDLRMLWNPGVSFGLLRANTDIVRWALAHRFSTVGLATLALFASFALVSRVKAEFIPPEDRAAMLTRIGVSSPEDLFADIPADKRLNAPLALPTHRGELAVERALRAMAGNFSSEKFTCFHCAST